MPTPSEFKSNIFLLFIKGSRAGRFYFGFQSTVFTTGRELSFLTDSGIWRIISSPHCLLPSGVFWKLPHHHHLPPAVWLNFPWLLCGICQLTLSIYWARLLISNIAWQTATICLAPGDWQSKFFQVVQTDIQNYRPTLFCETVSSKGKSPND